MAHRADAETHVSLDYAPYKMRIESITDETNDIKTFRLRFIDETEGRKFTFKAGQFGLYSVFGYGESPFCVSTNSNLHPTMPLPLYAARPL